MFYFLLHALFSAFNKYIQIKFRQNRNKALFVENTNLADFANFLHLGVRYSTVQLNVLNAYQVYWQSLKMYKTSKLKTVEFQFLKLIFGVLLKQHNIFNILPGIQICRIYIFLNSLNKQKTLNLPNPIHKQINKMLFFNQRLILT